MKNSKTVLLIRILEEILKPLVWLEFLILTLILIHEPSVGVVGNKGDSQCYLGVEEKVKTIHENLRLRIGQNPR